MMDKFVKRTPRPGKPASEPQSPVPGPSREAKRQLEASPSSQEMKKGRLDESTGNQERKKPTIRKFQSSWQVGRDWLIHDCAKNLMFCKFCCDLKELATDSRLKVMQKEGSFIEGTNNFKKSAITDHEMSKAHQKIAAVARAQQSSSNVGASASAAGKALIQLKENERSRLQILFRNAHAIAKKNRPIKDVEWLADLDEAKGLDVGCTYRNPHSGGLFIDSIAEVETSHLNDCIQHCSYFSLTMDGATDISSTEQETLFVRFVTKGEAETKFLKIVEPDSTESAALFEVVCSTLHQAGLDGYMDKFVGFSCDGASNMLGRKKGLAALLQERHPALIVIHCLAHRLELGYKDAIKKAAPKLYDQVLTLLVGLYYFFKRSSKQRRLLRKTFEMLGKTPLMPPRVGGTRWMGHMKRAIDWCIRAFAPIVHCLQDASHYNAKAEGLVKLLTRAENVAFILLLKDVLRPLGMLSLWLQKVDACLSEVYTISQTTMDMISQLKTLNNPALQALLDSKDEVSFQGCKLRGGAPTLKYKSALLEAVVSCVETRYTDLESPVISATRIASFRQWPANMSQDFGEEEVDILAKHFFSQESEIAHHQLLNEWCILRTLLYRSHGKKLAEQNWLDINRAMQGMGVDNALKLVDLILALPPTSVVNEMAFSQLKLIKTERRHRLGQDRLNNIMAVRLNGPDISAFNPDKAIDRWLVTPGGTRRRVNYKRQVKSAVVPDAAAASIDASEEIEAEPHTEEIARPLPVTSAEDDSDSDWEEDPDMDLGYESYDEQDFATNEKLVKHYQAELD